MIWWAVVTIFHRYATAGDRPAAARSPQQRCGIDDKVLLPCGGCAACHQGERNEARAADVRSARAHGPGLAQLRLLVRSCRRRLEVARLYSLSLALSLALFTKPGSIH